MISYDTGSFCFRNKIINGDMRIDQRSAGNTFTHTAGTTTYGSCDRWIGFCTGSNITSQRVSGNSFGQPFPYAALRITGAANNTAAQIIQRIEAINVYDLAGQSVTLSFRVVSSTTITGYAVITTAGGIDNWSSGTQVGSTGFTTTTTPSTVTYTFTMPSSVTNGVQITIGASPLLAGQTIDITNVQLEVGPTATPFEYRPIGTELALCQRYFEIVGSNSAMRAVGATGIQGCAVIRVPKRTTLTNSNISLTTTSPECAEVAINYRQATNATVAIQGGNLLSDVRITGFSGLTSGNLCTLYNDVIRVDTEL
jgi:hypothetical protein